MNEDYARGYDRGVLDTVLECQRLEHNWNELKKYIEEKLEYTNTYITNQNCKPQGDLGMQYYKAEIDKWRLEKVLSKIKELEEGGSNENN